MIGEVVETSASFEARFRATTLPDLHFIVPLPSYSLSSNSFICNTYNPPLFSVANKRLTVFAKPLRCNTYKKRGVGARR